MIVVDEEKVKDWFDRYMRWIEYSDEPGEGYVECTLITDSVETICEDFIGFVKK